MFCRRSKYMDFFICSSFIILFVYAYFSRQVLLEKLHREEDERLKLEHNANSLKEELKIVYYHTSKLEEALKAEQDSHKSTNSRLSSQSQDFKMNMTMLQRQYAAKLKEKTDNIKTFMLENEELKEKHKLVEKHFNMLAKEHKKVSIQIKTDYDKLKKTKDEESVRLQDEIQETYNRKVYFQKKAALNEDDYKKTLKKLARCKSILSRRNISTNSQMQKILSSNSALQKKTVKSSSKKKVKVIGDTIPTQASSKANTLPMETTIQLFDRLEELPTEKVIKREAQNKLPMQKKLNNHNLLEGLPTEKANTHPVLMSKLHIKQHGTFEGLPTETVYQQKKNIPQEELVDNRLVVNSSPTENINNQVSMEEVESPAKLPIVVTQKPAEETLQNNTEKHNNNEIIVEGDIRGKPGTTHAKHVVEEKIVEGDVAVPNPQIEDNT